MGRRKGRTVTWPRAMAVLACLGWIIGPHPRGFAAGYMDAKALGERLNQLAQSNPSLVRVKSVARSLGNRDIWFVELGKGRDDERTSRPAMLVVAGVEGNDVAGCAAAVTWIERLVDQYKSSDEIRKILDTTTLYIFPRLNPDAAEHFFTTPTVETSVSKKPVDDDHDGMTDEDGPEDLDGDGRIAWMRVQDPEGEYILDPAEPRLLIRADAVKGEVGAWRLLTEGIDNDHDEKWNEDGPGGVNFNRNFPYQYEWFAPWSGVHQVSEVESLALAGFVVGHPNIGIIFTFGAADNLVQTPRAEGPAAAGQRSEAAGAEASAAGGPHSGGARGGGTRGGAPRTEGPPTTAPILLRRPTSSINERDLAYYRQMGEVYRKALGLTRELTGGSQPGSFSDWMYFHRGRLSLAAQPWSPAMQLELAKAKPTETKKEDKPEGDGEKPAKRRISKAAIRGDDERTTAAAAERRADSARGNEPDRAFLKWLDKNAPDKFVAWHSFDHPDFPKQRVEIGGFAPFARTAPPESVLGEITTKHADFLTTLALRLPHVGIRKMTSKHLGESVYEVEIQIENTGYLPTVLAHGETTREVYPTRVVLLDLDSKAFLSGSRMTRLTAIPGSGGMKEIRYVLYVPDRKQVKVHVVSALGGTVDGTLELDGEKKP